MSKSKDVFGQFDAVEIVRSRNAMANAVVTELTKQLTGEGFIVESVQIESIDFSKDYEASVEARMAAQVEVEKVKQNFERKKIEADMVRAGAQGEADAKVMAAKAEAAAIEMRGKAEASAIKAKADALAQNPTLVHLIQAERWDGKLPATMIPNQSVPIIGAEKQ
jgi:regulator of protease activity HflC (stomatin/prohibitin superfamily)